MSAYASFDTEDGFAVGENPAIPSDVHVSPSSRKETDTDRFVAVSGAVGFAYED